MHIMIHTDGGARGNPGQAAIGVVIEQVMEKEKKVLSTFGKKIGETTNNVAEYTAVIEAWKHIAQQKTEWGIDTDSRIDFYLDSQLVVNQLNGIFKIKDGRIRMFVLEIKSLEQEHGGVVHYYNVPRSENSHADLLVNQALDSLQ